MSQTKKLLSLLLAIMMVFCLSVSAMAEGTPTEEGDQTTEDTQTPTTVKKVTITAPTNTTRAYKIYQIFTGDLFDGVLSNVKWGAHGKDPNGTAVPGKPVPQSILDTLANVDSGASNTTKLETIENYFNMKNGTPALATIGAISAGATAMSVELDAGYYVIEDAGPVNQGEAYSLYVVPVLGDITIEPKVSTTSSEKKVDDINDSDKSEDAEDGWQDSADYDIGDQVPFQLKATITQNYNDYTHGYKLVFHDKEDPGLTFDASTVKVYVDGTEIQKTSGDKTYYNVVTSCDDQDTFEIQFPNLKDISAVHAGSVITVEYKSVLNQNAKIGYVGNKNTMHITYTNNPNDEQAGDNGSTPDDTVIVFTFESIVNKVDQDGAALEGAEFSLVKILANKTEKVITLTKSANATDDKQNVFTATGLDAGLYLLTETKTPNGYNTIDPIYFVIEAEHDTSIAEPKLTKLVAYASDKDGNKLTGEAAFDFTPVNTDNNDTTIDGTLSTNVMNQSGSTLPSTGGMGTTLLYVGGGILVAAAAILLIFKKRMSVEK